MIDKKLLLELYYKQLTYLKSKPYSKQNMKLIRITEKSLQTLKKELKKL